MQPIIKRYFWMALLVAGLQSSFGFALLGPIPGGGADAWETAALGYRYGTTIFVDVPGGPAFLGDVGTPKNIAEEYRRNVPVMYYTYDQTFLNYFGPDGAAAVDGAFAIMNGLPSADQTDLTQFPLESMFYNYTAQADYLTDLKSVTLHMLVEQLGLADPARFVWTLHDRVPFGPVCPLDIGFIVVQRNFDYLVSSVNQIQYSSYINDVLYSYFILQGCTGTPIAITVPFSVDPEASIYTTVSANNYDGEGLFYLNNNGTQPLTTSGGLQVGAFYTGLTRDDMAGLHYLFTTNNVNLELPEPTSLLFSVITNTSLQQLFPNGPGTNIVGTNVTGAFYTYNGVYGYGNYGWLIATSQTNSPAVLLAQYPGLVIASSSNYFVLSSNITYTQYFAPLGYGTPYPSPLQLVTVTNYTPVLLEKYVTTFANVFPNRVTSNSVTYLQTTVVAPKPGTPYPAPPFTNVTTQAIIATNVPSGDFFLLPLFHTNVCPLDFLYTGLTNVVAITNFLTGAGTNVVTPTNTSSYSSTLSQINYFTNFIWVTHPVACAEVANAANYYQGIGGTRFVRADYDSLISQYFRPVTNYYNMVALTNSQWQVQHFVRVVVRPDFLMDAADQAEEPVFRSAPTFIPSPILNGLAGPGTIATPSVFSYTKIGDAYWNGYLFNTVTYAATNAYLGELGQIPSIAWASFDASTNAPEVYPNGTSIQNLESQLAVQLSPGSPPDGTNAVPYSVQFSASGGGFLTPFAWLATGLPGVVASGLPPGLTLSATGLLSGTPTASGTFDFILQLTDSSPSPRVVQWTFPITIH